MTDASKRIWIDDERPYGGEVHVYDETMMDPKHFTTETEYVLASDVADIDRLSTELVNVSTERDEWRARANALADEIKALTNTEGET